MRPVSLTLGMRIPHHHSLTLVIGSLLVLAACGAAGNTSAEDPGSDDAGTATTGADGAEQSTTASAGSPVVVDVERTDPGLVEDVPSGLETFRSPLPELPEPTIDLSQLRSGGPPPDGIPSVDDPVFYSAETVDYLAPTAPVLALEIDGDARAYPLEVMVWHEIVNDTVGGRPVAVAYCPLCNSVTVFDRRVEGRVLEFGVSGLLYNSSLVMYDRQTETLWSHFVGEPLYGALGEAELVDYPATIVGFDDVAGRLSRRPRALPRDRRGPAVRSEPVPRLRRRRNDPFLFEGDVDGRYTAMTRMVGVTADDGGPRRRRSRSRYSTFARPA